VRMRVGIDSAHPNVLQVTTKWPDLSDEIQWRIYLREGGCCIFVKNLPSNVKKLEIQTLNMLIFLHFEGCPLQNVWICH
jgi:hypothetical protein